MPANTLTDLISQARNAAPYTVRDRGPHFEPQYLPKRAAAMRSLNLKASFLPRLFDKNGRMISAPIGMPAGEKIALDAAVVAASRVAQAGAHVLIRDDQLRATPIGTDKGVVMADVLSTFSTIEPAIFSDVADDADVAVTAALPMHRATMDWSTAQGVAVRFEVPRSTLKDYDQELFSNELLLALGLGLGRAADRLMLAAVAAATPAPFSLAAAAAQGLKAGELRALIGTSAAGAAFRADGQLTAAGIDAELTADMAGTLVGAWDRAAIAISNDVHLLAERTAKNGTLAVTAWAHMIPMLPDTSKFWSVA